MGVAWLLQQAPLFTTTEEVLFERKLQQAAGSWSGASPPPHPTFLDKPP